MKNLLDRIMSHLGYMPKKQWHHLSVNLTKSKKKDWYNLEFMFEGKVLPGGMGNFLCKAPGNVNFWVESNNFDKDDKEVYFKGSMSSIFVFNRVLPQKEIKALYKLG